MGKKLLIFAGLTSLLQAVTQVVFSSLSIAQYFCLIDFLRELPQLIFIRILYYHNPDTCGVRVNIGQAIDGIANQAFVLLMNEPFTVTRTYAINCISLSLGVLWIIVSCVILAGGARNEYSRPIRWPWIAVTVAICALDLTVVVIFANDSFHTKTLNAIMNYIGGTASGVSGRQLDTSSTAWIMVSLYSRFMVFFVLNVVLIVLVALNKSVSSIADDIKVEDPDEPIPVIPAAPIMSTPAQEQAYQEGTGISVMAQVIRTPVMDEPERTTESDVIAPTTTQASTNTKPVPESKTLVSIPLSNITEATSIGSARDLQEASLLEEETLRTSNIVKSDKDTASSIKIPRPAFSQAFQNMKNFLFNKESKKRQDSIAESLEVSPERSPELGRFLVRLVNNINRDTVQDNKSSVSNIYLTRRQGRPSLPVGWLVLSAILSRSPRIQHVNEDKKRGVHFPENLLSLPQRLENMIAEQQRRLDRSVIDTSGRTSPPRTSQSLPQLNSTNEETPAFNKSRRGTAAELQGQLPWAYIHASAHRMRDQLPPDEDLPPVPLPDYTAIQTFRKTSVHRAASSTSSLTHKKLYTNQLPRNKFGRGHGAIEKYSKRRRRRL